MAKEHLYPQTQKTRDGLEAIVMSKGIDQRLFGSIPGHYTFTWWYNNGRHNTFSNHDLVDLMGVTEA